jgi:hypothetical protein
MTGIAGVVRSLAIAFFVLGPDRWEILKINLRTTIYSGQLKIFRQMFREKPGFKW